MIASAEKSARGTVRVGSRSSPLGTSAISRPTNAKISTIAVLPTADAAGIPGQRRYSPLHEPDARRVTRTRSGSSLATVTASTRRTPGLTPRMFTAARTAKSDAISTVRTPGAANAGQSTPTEPAKALATEATAKVAIRK